MIAKICSDMNKPNGQFAVNSTPKDIEAFMKVRKVQDIQGIGPVKQSILNHIGIVTIHNILEEPALVWAYDKSDDHKEARWLIEAAVGSAQNVQDQKPETEKKQLGVTKSGRAAKDKETMIKWTNELAKELEQKMHEYNVEGTTIVLDFRDAKDWKESTRQLTLLTPISKSKDLAKFGKDIIEMNWPMDPVNRIAMHLKNLTLIK